MPEDGGQSTFREYFDGLTEAEQDRLFGQGRADLFRRGVITQSDLVGQQGQTLTLWELAQHLPPDERVRIWTGADNYRRLAAELSAGQRAAGAQFGPSEAEMVAIRHYTGSGYEAMNAALWAGQDRLSTVAPTCSTMRWPSCQTSRGRSSGEQPWTRLRWPTTLPAAWFDIRPSQAPRWPRTGT